jgi:hypothetical protein
MVISFLLTSFLFQKKEQFRKQLSFFAQLLISMVVTYYEFGGFTLTPAGRATSIKSAQELSCTLTCLIDSRGQGFISTVGGNPNSWEGWRYLGFSTLILIGLSICWSLFSAFGHLSKIFKYFHNYALILFLPCLFLFVFSWGPVWSFHGKSINFAFFRFFNPAFETFRATGRFAIPLVCLLICTSVLVIDKFHFDGQALGLWFLIILVPLQFLELSRLYDSISITAHTAVAGKFQEDPKLNQAFSDHRKIAIVEAYSGDIENIPWQEFSYYSIKFNYTIESFHYLARFDYPTAVKLQNESIKEFLKCELKPDYVYVIHDFVYSQMNRGCKAKLSLVKHGHSWNYFISSPLGI